MLVKFKNNILIVILVFFTISFVMAGREPFFQLFFYFDFLMVGYILLNLVFTGRFVVSKSTVSIIKVFSIIFLPSIFLLLFSQNIIASFGFLGQYLFSVLVINVFLDNVNSNNHLRALLLMMLAALVLNSFLFMYVHFYSDASLYFPEWGGRFSLGGFTPNEMGHYMVLLLFLINVFVARRKRLMLEMLTIFPYVLTMSKTVWVQLSIYLLLKRTVFVIASLVALHIYMLVSGDFILYRYVGKFVAELDVATTSNSVRMAMVQASLDNLVNTILFPAYHSIDNIKLGLEKAVSAHNGFLSYITNFGLISFALLTLSLVFFVYMKWPDKSIRYVFVFLFLDLVLLLFNPLINARIVWFPMFLYIFIINNKVFCRES